MDTAKKINIRGLWFLPIAKENISALIKELLSNDKCSVIYTPNAEIAYDATKNDELCSLLNRADILLPDGEGIILASKILKKRIREKIAGVEFGEAIAQVIAQTGHTMYILGGRPGIARTAADNLMNKYLGLKIVGTHDGYFQKDGDENDGVIKAINDCHPDVLFVCFGAPMQEKWTDVNKIYLNSIKIIACLGGSTDVYAGVEKRAPRIMISMKIEWLYRLIKHPDRIKRMTKLPKYIFSTFLYRFGIGGSK